MLSRSFLIQENCWICSLIWILLREKKSIAKLKTLTFEFVFAGKGNYEISRKCNEDVLILLKILNTRYSIYKMLHPKQTGLVFVAVFSNVQVIYSPFLLPQHSSPH